jgi:hypothetical protein
MSMTNPSRFALVLAACMTAASASRSALAQPMPGGQDDYDQNPPPPPDDEQMPQTGVPPSAEPPPQAPDERTFETQLSPYGHWVDTPEYGRVWVPNVGQDWQPYTDGQWVSTGYGWSFSSPAPWGWAVYHYGRWGWRTGFGWYWVPGYAWGPGWVSWRWTNGYACWAPLGPRGYRYPRYWPGWVVVPHSHFAHPIRRFIVPRSQVSVIVRQARPVRAFPTARPRGIAPGRVVPNRGVHRAEPRRK